MMHDPPHKWHYEPWTPKPVPRSSDTLGKWDWVVVGVLFTIILIVLGLVGRDFYLDTYAPKTNLYQWERSSE